MLRKMVSDQKPYGHLKIVQTLICIIVKFRINWALSNSLNTYNRHSDWHKLEVCATNVSIYL